jgi:glycosyltransferase involved in cell wall biosynthesis
MENYSNHHTPSSLSVIIPAYNEEDGIKTIIDRVLAVRGALADVGITNLELIVVDDGSTDRTSEIVKSCESTRLIQHPVNKGYGSALKTGFLSAKSELLGFLDADGTYPPEYFPNLCQEAINGGELVVGSRRSGSSSEMPFVRKLGNLIWSNLVTLLSGKRVIDPASGMRVFYSAILERLLPLPDGLNLTPVMSTRAVHEGVKLVEIPIPYEERRGRSKLNVVTDGVLFLQTILWTALYYNPVRLLGGIGIGFLALSALIFAILVIMRLSGITMLGPFGVASTYISVVSAFLGVTLFSLGATFNYLVSLFHKRPIQQGLFGKPILKTPIDLHFWWMGLLSVFAGGVIGLVSFILALGDWPIERLWMYLLAGTLLIVVGVQLVIYWIIMRVLDELSQREAVVRNDLGSNIDLD